MPTEQGLSTPGHTGSPLPNASKARAKVGWPQRRLSLRQAEIDPPFIFDPLSLSAPDDLSCGNWDRL